MAINGGVLVTGITGQQGTAAAECLLRRGVKVVGLTRNSGKAAGGESLPLETKGRIEEHLRKSGVPFTIFRPVFFMENFASPWMLPAIRQGKLVNPVRANVALQMIALRDIGEFVAPAFTRPKEFLGQAVELAGDELTMPGTGGSIPPGTMSTSRRWRNAGESR